MFDEATDVTRPSVATALQEGGAIWFGPTLSGMAQAENVRIQKSWGSRPR